MSVVTMKTAYLPKILTNNAIYLLTIPRQLNEVKRKFLLSQPDKKDLCSIFQGKFKRTASLGFVCLLMFVF